MTISNLLSWADNLQIIWIPDVETDISMLQTAQLETSTELSAGLQELRDAVAAQQASVTGLQNVIGTIQSQTEAALTQIGTMNGLAQSYADQLANALREELTTNTLTVADGLSDTLSTSFAQQIAAMRPELVEQLDGVVANIELTYANLMNELIGFNGVSQEILDNVLPKLTTIQQDALSQIDDVRSQFDLLLTDYSLPDLLSGLNAVQAKAEKDLVPIGGSVLRGPNSLWSSAATLLSGLARIPTTAGSFLTDDASFGECFEFASGNTDYIGPAFPMDFVPGRVYKVAVTFKVIDNGSLGLGSRPRIGASTATGATPVQSNIQLTLNNSVAYKVSDGVVTQSVYISSDESKLINYGVGASNRLVLSASEAANKIYVFFRQNASTAVNGKIRLASLYVTDVTEVLDGVNALRLELNSNINGLSSTLTQDYYTAVDVKNAIAGVETGLTAKAADLKATLNNRYYTSVQVDDKITGAESTIAGQVTAATAAKLAAETARSGAETARTDAVTAKNSAEGAASSAGTSATNAANSATTAGNSATAAATSASSAATQATNAAQSATAANTSKLAAETAKSGAESAQTESSIARDDAVQAKSDAQTASTAASTSLTLSSRIVGQGTGALLDQFLGTTAGWVAFNTGPTWTTNSKFAQGRDGTWSLTAGTQGAMTLSSGVAAWPGPVDASGYYIEIDFTLNSGSISGAGLVMDWVNTVAGVFRVSKPIADLVAQPVVIGRFTTARGIFVKPSTFTGTFSFNRIYAMANWSTFDATNPAKNLTIHRVYVRTATEEEMGNGQVMARLSQVFLTSTQTDTAIAGKIDTYDASIPGGVKSTVTEHVTAISSLNSKSAAAYVLRLSTGGASAGLELATFDNANGGAASAIKLRADQIGLFGDVYVTSGNLWQDHDMVRTEMYAGENGTTYTFVSVTGTGSGWSGLGLRYMQLSAGAAEKSVVGSWFRIEPSTEYLVTGKAGMDANTAGGGTCTLQFQTANDVAGVRTVIDTTTIASNTDTSINSSAWGAVTVTPSTDALYGRFRMVRAAGGTGAARSGGWRIEKKAGADLLVDGGIKARHIETGELRADHIGSGQISAGFLKIDASLAVEQTDAGFAFGKTSPADFSTDGLYMGRSKTGAGGTGFGFLMGKTTPGGFNQSIQHTTDAGLKITNARFALNTGAYTETVVTSSQTITLPVGSTRFNLAILGGGGGGGAPGTSYSTKGGTTTVQLWNGNTNTGISWTSEGGLNGGAATKNGENSALGTGGTGATASYNPRSDIWSSTTSATAGSGYGAGGGAGMTLTSYGTVLSGKGGAAASVNNISEYDISGIANPKLVITIGAAGSTGAAYAAAGSPGYVKISTGAITSVDANVVPLRPTATGSFTKASNATGNTVFPNLGAGMWIINGANSEILCLNDLRISDTGPVTLKGANARSMTFVADIRPNIITGNATAVTINYAFYSMATVT